jgi:predicted phosphoadenosine phosphosulfate sulfurtransferase
LQGITASPITFFGLIIFREENNHEQTKWIHTNRINFVIVILGILAVAAAPRFINLSDDAEKTHFLVSQRLLKVVFNRCIMPG